MKVNRVLTELYYDAMTQVPTPTYTPEELDFAKQITEEAGLINDGTLFSGLEPLEDEPVPIAIGTDASQVSHTVPLITLSAATMCKGTPLHHWAPAQTGRYDYRTERYALCCKMYGRRYEIIDGNTGKY